MTPVDQGNRVRFADTLVLRPSVSLTTLVSFAKFFGTHEGLTSSPSDQLPVA